MVLPETFNDDHIVVLLFNNVVPLTCNDVSGVVVPIPTLPVYNKDILGLNVVVPVIVYRVLFITQLPISYLKLFAAPVDAAYLTTPE